MAASICCGLRSSSVAPASSAAFEQLCQITTGTKGTVSADILFGVAHSSIASTDLASPATPATPAFQHLFGPIAHGAQLFTSAASQYSSFGELACADPTRAALLSSVAASVNVHFGGLYQGAAVQLVYSCT